MKFSNFIRFSIQSQQLEVSLKLSCGEEVFPAKINTRRPYLIFEKFEFFKTGLLWLPTPNRIGLSIQNTTQCLLLPQWIQRVLETSRIRSFQLDTVRFQLYRIWAKALGAAINRRNHWTKVHCGTLLLDVCSTYVIAWICQQFQQIDLQRSKTLGVYTRVDGTNGRFHHA